MGQIADRELGLHSTPAGGDIWMRPAPSRGGAEYDLRLQPRELPRACLPFPDSLTLERQQRAGRRNRLAALDAVWTHGTARHLTELLELFEVQTPWISSAHQKSSHQKSWATRFDPGESGKDGVVTAPPSEGGDGEFFRGNI